MLALGIVLIVIGAILNYAVSAAVEGVDLVIIGNILMGAGGIAFLVGLVQQFTSGSSRVRSTREESDDGRTVIEDKRVD